MTTKIKIDLPAMLKSNQPIILDLGCGRVKKPGRIGIGRGRLVPEAHVPGFQLAGHVDPLRHLRACVGGDLRQTVPKPGRQERVGVCRRASARRR